MPEKPIRVMIIDDSLFFREFMSRSLSVDSSVEVVGMVKDAQEALQKIAELRPNLITLDIEMGGIQYRNYIRRLRSSYPEVQVIIISPLTSSVFEALKAGAVDFVAKPNIQLHIDNAGFVKEVLNKIKAIYSGSMPGAPVRPVAAASTPEPTSAATAPRPAVPSQVAGSAYIPLSPMPMPLSVNIPNANQRVIAIGASTGGTEAILAVVKDLPQVTPGILLVQHMPPVFTKMYAERLNKLCKMSAREAQNGDRVKPGLILVAEGDKQMRLAKDTLGYYVKIEPGEKVSGHCPSVDVLFDSVATVARSNAVGVILTGMGGDGAKNLLKMREAGAHTIGQDEATCVVYGMPMVAYNLGAVVEQLPLTSIGGAILRVLSK